MPQFVTCIDTFSRFAFVVPLTKDRASETVQNLVSRVFAVVGPPRYLITDGASNMNKSEAFQNMCTKYNITPKIRSPYSSRSLGLCERVHRTIQESMRALIASYDITWLDASPLAVGMYNSLTHSALNNYSPYEVFFGKTSPFVLARLS